MPEKKPALRTRKLGIRFSDNDFHTTMYAFLSYLGTVTGDDTAYRDRSLFSFSKKEIVILFNISAAAFYFLQQNRLSYNKPKDGVWTADVSRMRNYLTIGEDEVFFDEEVDQYIKEHEWDNSEFFYALYVELHDGTVHFQLSSI